MLNCEAGYFESVGDTMPMEVGPLFWATVRDAAVVTGGRESAAIDTVAMPVAAVPDGSVTLYVNVDDVPKRPLVGLKIRVVSWATLRVRPIDTGVTPSDR
jgi:hypothetical protein